MEIFNQHHEAIAVLTAPIFWGMLFFFQKYDAIFRFVFPKLALLIFLLLVPHTMNQWSVDNIVFGINN